MTRILLSLLLLSYATLGLAGCDDGPALPPTSGGGGWTFTTLSNINALGEPMPLAGIPFVVIHGQWVEDGCPAPGGFGLLGPRGSAQPWSDESNDAAVGIVTNGRVCATWKNTWVTPDEYPGCAGATGTVTIPGLYSPYVYNQPIICTYAGGVVPGTAFTASPGIINSASPPTSITITGSGLTSNYGMPLLQYFAPDGTLAAHQTASSVSSDGTTMTASVGSLSSVIPGLYTGMISNAGPNGTYSLVGATNVQVIGPFPASTTAVSLIGIDQDANGTLPAVAAYDSGSNTFSVAGTADAGTVSIAVNGYTKSVSYSSDSPFNSAGDTGSTVASRLATAFNGDSNSPVTASASGGTLTLTSKSGSGTKLSVSATSQSGLQSPYSGLPSIIAIPAQPQTP